MNKEPIPGTHEEGFVEQPFLEFGDKRVREMHVSMGSKGIKFFHMGECTIIIAREPFGPAFADLLWHMSISHRDRHPTWDEIKTARYRLLPLDRCFGMLLPPPEHYVNVSEQDHVFHVWEVTDPREPWTAG